MSNAGRSQLTMPRINNFDMLRLCFAWMVVFYHASVLSAAKHLAWVAPLTDGTVAVQGFFAISGCLIGMSYDRDRNLMRYLRRRAQRLLPAYYASTVAVLTLGSFLSKLGPVRFLTSRETLKYLAANLVFMGHLHPNLPGLFSHNPFSAGVNGALWTIKIEVIFYMFVPVLFWLFERMGRLQVIAALSVASLVYHGIFTKLGLPGYAKQFPGELCFFLVGTAVYLYFPIFKRFRTWMWSGAAAAILLFVVTHLFVFRLAGVSLMTMNIGLLLPVFKGPTAYGDFSYGTYVLHYPLIQFMVGLGVFAFSPVLGLGLCTVGVMMLSVLSWILVEKRFLNSQRIARPDVQTVAAAF